MTGSAFTPHADYIAQALATEGGHLNVGRYGATLHFGGDCRLHIHTNEIKAECVGAGVPVIDSRPVPIEVLADLVMRSPEVRAALGGVLLCTARARDRALSRGGSRGPELAAAGHRRKGVARNRLERSGSLGQRRPRRRRRPSLRRRLDASRLAQR